MGSALGPTFTSFYICNLEPSVLEQPEFCPKIYCTYVDDILVAVNNVMELESLRTQMERQSVQKCTYEIAIDNKLLFLDVAVPSNGLNLVTKVYRKPTDK